MATHALLLRDIINQTLRMCQDYFGEGYIAGRTWTRAQVIIAINQALLEWSRVTGFLRGEDTVNLTEGTKTYDLPDDCLQLLRVAFYDDNACAWVGEPTNITDRDLASLPITGSSVPIKFFLEHLAYSKFGFQPNVGDDYTAYLYYIRSHVYADVEANTLEAAIPTWFHRNIKFGASAILLAEAKEQHRKDKGKYCKARWDGICEKMRTIKAQHGPDLGTYVL
jgi:hypothetical protein